MKKTITLFMALALVTSLMAVPVSPKLQKQGKQKAQTEQKMEQRAHVMPQINMAKVQDLVRPEVRKAPVAKKNINRNAVRKAVQTSTFSFVSSTPAGWTVNPTPYGYETKESTRGMQMTANTTITYAGAEDVSSITVTGSTNGTGNTISVKVGTTDFGSVSLTKGDSHKAYTFSGTKSSGNVVITVTRAAKSIWIESVSLDGTGGGGGGEEGDTIQITSMDYAYAYYYYDEGDDYEGYFWDFQLVTDSEDGTPSIYWMGYDEAASGTAIAGEYLGTAYAHYVETAGDTVVVGEDAYEDASMTITYNKEDGTYTFAGEFVGEDEVTYIFNVTVEVAAYDEDENPIELDEEGGVTPTGVDTVKVPVNYVQAMRYDSYSSTGSYDWQISALNYTDATHYENLWFEILTPQNNRLEGIYDIESGNIASLWGYYYYAGYMKVNGAGDTTSVAAGSENIQLLVAYDETNKAYDLVGELLSEDGKTLYQFAVEDMNIIAFDEEEKDIVLMDSVEFVPDTIDITGMDAIEFAYYASYSEEGAYNYSVNLYNSQDDNYPYLALDIYTEFENQFVGQYDTTTNVGEYSGYYPNVESYGESVINPVFTISKDGEVYTIAGMFEGADQNFYRFSVSAEATMADGDYPYEPLEKQADVNIVANSKTAEVDYDDVVYDDALYLLLNGETDTVQLVLNTTKTTLANGTYEITTSYEPEANDMIAGYYYYGLNGCMAYVGNDVYYLTAGSLVVATANDTVTYSLNATSAHGTVVTAVYKEYKAPIETYTVEEAISAYDGKELQDDDEIAIKGYITSIQIKPTNFNKYHSAIIWISDTKGTSKDFELYNSRGMDNYAFQTFAPYSATGSTLSEMTSVSDSLGYTFVIGDFIEAYGKIKKYNSTYELQQDCYITSGGTPTGLKEASDANKADGKMLMNGRLYIRKNDVLYNAQGQIVR